MENRSGARIFAWLIAAHVVCCGVLLLAIAGVVNFSGIGNWLIGEGGVYLIALLTLAIAALCLRCIYPRHITEKPKNRRAQSREIV